MVYCQNCFIYIMFTTSFWSSSKFGKFLMLPHEESSSVHIWWAWQSSVSSIMSWKISTNQEYATETAIRSLQQSHKVFQLMGLPARPSPVGRGILSEPAECFRRSWRDFCTRFSVQSWCHTGSSRPLMHWMMRSFSSAVRRPFWWATYTMKDMSMLTASPWSSVGKTLCLGQKKVGNRD